MRNIIIYHSKEGNIQLDVNLEKETLWLSQKQMSGLFKTTTDNIGLHLKNIYEEGELQEDPTTEDYSVVRTEGKRRVTRKIRHYNLDAIISVGYRVNSSQATQFRIWATQILKNPIYYFFA